MPRTSVFIFFFIIITILSANTSAQEVKLPLAEYEKLRSRSGPAPDSVSPPPAPFALELADFEVKAGPESARVVQTLRFTLYADGWQTVPLGETGSFIRADFGGMEGRVRVAEKGGWSLEVRGHGRHEVKLESVLAVARDETATRPTWRLGLKAPAAAVVRGRLEAPEGVEDADPQGAVVSGAVACCGLALRRSRGRGRALDALRQGGGAPSRPTPPAVRSHHGHGLDGASHPFPGARLDRGSGGPGTAGGAAGAHPRRPRGCRRPRPGGLEDGRRDPGPHPSLAGRGHAGRRDGPDRRSAGQVLDAPAEPRGERAHDPAGESLSAGGRHPQPDGARSGPRARRAGGGTAARGAPLGQRPPVRRHRSGPAARLGSGVG